MLDSVRHFHLINAFEKLGPKSFLNVIKAEHPICRWIFNITAPHSGDDGLEFREDVGCPEWNYPCFSSSHSNTYQHITVWKKGEGVEISQFLMPYHVVYLEENKTIKIMYLNIFRFVYLYQELAIRQMKMFW